MFPIFTTVLWYHLKWQCHRCWSLVRVIKPNHFLCRFQLSSKATFKLECLKKLLSEESFYSSINLYYVLRLSHNYLKRKWPVSKPSNIFTPLSVKWFYAPAILLDHKPWWTSTTIISERWQLLQTTHCHWAQIYRYKVWQTHHDS